MVAVLLGLVELPNGGFLESSAGKIKNDNMADDAFYQFLLAAFQNTEAVMADDAPDSRNPASAKARRKFSPSVSAWNT